MVIIPKAADLYEMIKNNEPTLKKTLQKKKTLVSASFFRFFVFLRGRTEGIYLDFINSIVKESSEREDKRI